MRLAFHNFKQYLRAASRDAAQLLASFETPPAFELWHNPVTSKALRLASLGPTGNRSLIADNVFSNCNASNLCDDGHHLVDGGINQQDRLWLVYQFHSLTDYQGQSNYTSISALISAITNDQCATDLFFGFDWNQPEAPCRLIFEESEATILKTVLIDEAWRAVHRMAYRPTRR